MHNINQGDIRNDGRQKCMLYNFNTELLIIGIGSWHHLLIVIITAVIAMLVFAAATQGYFLTKNRIWETIALLLIAFTLFRPGYFWDMAFPPFIEKPGTELVQVVEDLEPGSMLRLNIKGETMNGDEYTKAMMFPVGAGKTGVERINDIGFETRNEDGKILVDNVVFSSNAEKMGIDFDQEILLIKIPSDRLPKQLMFIPALALLALVYSMQRKRRDTLVAT